MLLDISWFGGLDVGGSFNDGNLTTNVVAQISRSVCPSTNPIARQSPR
jgi:hypothetical protein